MSFVGSEWTHTCPFVFHPFPTHLDGGFDTLQSLIKSPLEAGLVGVGGELGLAPLLGVAPSLHLLLQFTLLVQHATSTAAGIGETSDTVQQILTGRQTRYSRH